MARGLLSHLWQLMALNLIDLSDSGLVDKKLHKEDNSSKVGGQWAKPGEIRLDKDKDKKNAQDGQFFFRQREQHLNKTRYAPVWRQDGQRKRWKYNNRDKEKIAQGGQFLHGRTTMGQNQIVLLISPWAAPWWAKKASQKHDWGTNERTPRSPIF